MQSSHTDQSTIERSILFTNPKFDSSFAPIFQKQESLDTLRRNHYFLRGRRSAFGQKPREFITNVLFAKLETAMRQKIKPDPFECKETGVKTTAIIPGTQRFSINW